MTSISGTSDQGEYAFTTQPNIIPSEHPAFVLAPVGLAVHRTAPVQLADPSRLTGHRLLYRPWSGTLNTSGLNRSRRVIEHQLRRGMWTERMQHGRGFLYRMWDGRWVVSFVDHKRR